MAVPEESGSAARPRGRYGAWVSYQLRDLAAGVLGVIGRPSMGFFRLAEEGGRLWPVVIAGLVGLAGSGAQPFKAVLVAAVGGRPACVPWFGAAFVLLFPLYYAGSAAGFALVGWLLGGGRTGLRWRELFWRLWRVLGWSNLPLLIPVVAFLIYLLTLGRPALDRVLADLVPGTIPSFAFSFTSPIYLGFGLVAVWAALLLVIGLRQALAGSTGQALAVIAAAGLLFGGLVHTPVARGVLTSFPDTYQVMGRGQVSVSASLQAYRLPSPRLPAPGDLVAYSRAGGGKGITFALYTPVGPFFQFGTPRLAYLGRVIGLPGDTVSVRGGAVYKNGLPAAEGHLASLGEHQVRQVGLEIEEIRVGPDSIFVLPDDRSVVPNLPGAAGPLIAADRVLGRIVSVQRNYVLSTLSQPDEAPSGSGAVPGVRANELVVTCQGDPRIFTLYAGLNRSGYDEEFGAAMHPVRQQVRDALASADSRDFELFRTISARSGPWQLQGVALREIGPPPDFSPGPGSGALAADLSVALASFWRAHGEVLWREHGPAHDELAAGLLAPARDAIQATLAYCREDYSPASSVLVIPNLLASAKTASLIFDEATGAAYVLTGPGEGQPLNAVVHEFCHRVVGRTVSRLVEVGALNRFQPVLDRAVAGDTVASQSYASLRSYVEDCLVRALTIRVRPDDQVQERLARESGWGFFLVRPFWEALQDYETADRKLIEDLPAVLAGVNVDALLREVEAGPPGGS